MRAVLHPDRAASSAAEIPAGPAPATTTSYTLCFMFTLLPFFRVPREYQKGCLHAFRISSTPQRLLADFPTA
jgi:hypothetical protein